MSRPRFVSRTSKIRVSRVTAEETRAVLVLLTLWLHYEYDNDLITHFQLMYLHIPKRNDNYRYEEVRNSSVILTLRSMQREEVKGKVVAKVSGILFGGRKK